jgi:membrane-bound serine protease (ClpP class)
MLRTFIKVLTLLMLAGTALGAQPADKGAPAAAPAVTSTLAKKVTVIVIPVRDQISDPVHYILRRGLKEGVDVVVLDMNTPGGSAGTALEMMEALSKFSGKTITYVNAEAMSAGAFIAAATEEIWFAPNGVIGAAAAVTSEGQDIPETMRLKLNSFLRAKIRAISEGKGYRGEVVSAMIDKDYELRIGDKVLKGKGELLSLTATEAAKTYGEPPQALLAAGIAKDIDELLTKKYGAGNYEKRTFEITWSENLAQLLSKVTPLLLGLGLLALFIEFKTPGFGVFGVSGIVLLVIVFLSSYVSGLSGHEPILFFALGVILLALELAFFHSAGFLGVVGLLMMLGSLVWAMADIWPNQPLSVTWSGDVLVAPLKNLFIGLVVAGGLLALVARFLPHGWIWQRLAVGGAVSGAGVATAVVDEQEALVGREGVAATSLFPSGQIEIEGRRYEARLEVGFVEAGTPVRVVRRTGFNLIVEAKKS